MLRYTWPPLPSSLKLTITTHGIPFQDTSLPESAIVQSWNQWLSDLDLGCLIATDTSKDAGKTTVAAVDALSTCVSTALIPHISSVFSAEALAIHLH